MDVEVQRDIAQRALSAMNVPHDDLDMNMVPGQWLRYLTAVWVVARITDNIVSVINSIFIDRYMHVMHEDSDIPDVVRAMIVGLIPLEPDSDGWYETEESRDWMEGVHESYMHVMYEDSDIPDGVRAMIVDLIPWESWRLVNMLIGDAI